MPFEVVGKPINRLRGVVPVPSIWDVNPTNLERCTDGDWANQTGVGNKVLVGGGHYGQLLFDMGAAYSVLVRGKILIGNSDAGGIYVCLYGSEDGVNYYTFPGYSYELLMWYMVPPGSVTIFIEAFLRARYIKLLWIGECNGTWYGAVSEIEAIDFNI